MKHKFYFPRDIAGQRAWLVNYKAQIAIVGPSLGLIAVQISAAQNECQLMIAEIDATDATLTAAKAKVAERDTLIQTQMGLLRTSIGGIKKTTNYTEALGAQLDIVGAEIAHDNSTVRTQVKLGVVPQGVDIKFTLEQCKSGNIYSMRGAETGFTFFKTVTHPHTIDTRPNQNNAATEKRQYYVTLVNNDVEIGVPSQQETISL